MKKLLVKLNLQILYCILLFCFSCNTNYYSNEDLIGLWSYDYNSKHNKHVENYRINSGEFSSFDIGNPINWNIQFLPDSTFEQNAGIPRKGRFFIKKVSTDYYIQLVYSDGDISEGGLRL